MLYKITPIFILMTLFSCSNSDASSDTNQEKVEFITFETSYKFNQEIKADCEAFPADWRDQIFADEYALKGNHEMALKYWDSAFQRSPLQLSNAQLDSFSNKYKSTSALEYIGAVSKLNQIVIINEEHHNSYHRIFTKSLLQTLYDNGYTHLGLETLSSQDTLLNSRKYPVQESGTYTKNPQFGDLVRTALEIGYVLFDYEVSGHNVNGKEREIAQARNIEKMVNANPDAKFLIHCGFSHVYEGELFDWEKSMAGRLTEYTGIDPFTIDQTAFSEKSERKYQHPYLNLLDPEESIILLDDKGLPLNFELIDSKNNYWADLAVFHPITAYNSGRPDWMINAGSKGVLVKVENIEIDYPVMIMAFKVDEDINKAVPIDLIEVENESLPANLVLEHGEYNVVVTNQKGKAYKYHLAVEMQKE